MDRRRTLKTLFCSSATLSLNLRASDREEVAPSSDAMHFLAIGDFGTSGKDQRAVAKGMQRFVREHNIVPEALLLLGDNIYSEAKDGFSVDSERWSNTFEDVYPRTDFPGQCPAVLGNHDYHDNAGGEKIQLAYSATRDTRYLIPDKWYRLDLGQPKPLVTVLALDSNLPSVSGRSGKASLSEDEAGAQLRWLQDELEKPRAPFTFVLAHHPLYSNGRHGDTEGLHKAGWSKLLEEHEVDLYLCGHDHDLQHLEIEGLATSFVLSGGGGANIRALKSEREIPFAQEVHGFSHIEVLPDRFSVSHRDKGARLLHRFTKDLDGSVSFGS